MPERKGYLYREAPSGLRSIKKRWFVLSREHCRLFFSQKEGQARALGTINLDGAACSKFTHKKRDFGMRIMEADKTKHVVFAESADEFEQWMTAIIDVSNSGKAFENLSDVQREKRRAALEGREPVLVSKEEIAKAKAQLPSKDQIAAYKQEMIRKYEEEQRRNQENLEKVRGEQNYALATKDAGFGGLSVTDQIEQQRRFAQMKAAAKQARKPVQKKVLIKKMVPLPKQMVKTTKKVTRKVVVKKTVRVQRKVAKPPPPPPKEEEDDKEKKDDGDEGSYDKAEGKSDNDDDGEKGEPKAVAHDEQGAVAADGDEEPKAKADDDVAQPAPAADDDDAKAAVGADSEASPSDTQARATESPATTEDTKAVSATASRSVADVPATAKNIKKTVKVKDVVEAVTAHDQVADCVIMPVADPASSSRKALLAYVVVKKRSAALDVVEGRVDIVRVGENDSEELDQKALRKFASQTLPDYMVPAMFVKVESLPRDDKGKVKKKRLPVPETTELAAAIKTHRKLVAAAARRRDDLEKKKEALVADSKQIDARLQKKEAVVATASAATATAIVDEGVVTNDVDQETASTPVADSAKQASEAAKEVVVEASDTTIKVAEESTATKTSASPTPKEEPSSVQQQTTQSEEAKADIGAELDAENAERDATTQSEALRKEADNAMSDDVADASSAKALVSSGVAVLEDSDSEDEVDNNEEYEKDKEETLAALQAAKKSLLESSDAVQQVISDVKDAQYDAFH